MSRTTRRSQFKETAYRNVESYVRHHPHTLWVRFLGSAFAPGPVDARWYLDYTSGRDGRCSEGLRKRYRDETNGLIRVRTCRKEKALLSDPELYDDMTFETKLDGKFIAWDIW